MFLKRSALRERENLKQVDVGTDGGGSQNQLDKLFHFFRKTDVVFSSDISLLFHLRYFEAVSEPELDPVLHTCDHL